MDQRLGSLTGIIAALLIVTASSVVDAQSKQEKQLADALFKSGISAFQKGQYDVAIEKFKKSIDLVPNNNALYAWAQAVRLAGGCDEAIPLYEKLLNQTGYIKNEVVIRENMLLCTKPRDKLLREQEQERDRLEAEKQAADDKRTAEEEERARQEAAANKESEKAPPPTSSTSSGADTLTLAMMAVGGVGVGIGSGFFVASNASSEGADNAGTYETNLRLRDQAKTQRIISIAAGTTGLALMGYGLFRLLTSSESSETEAGGISIVATPDLQGVSYVGSF